MKELNPEVVLRELICSRLGLANLPPTKSMTIHHVRGVGNPIHLGGPDKESVPYEPEFLYVLDVGYPERCGVVVPWTSSGLGDPRFPDFAKGALRSVHDLTPDSLIFPKMVGELLVGVEPGTTEQTVRAGLAQHATSVERSSTDVYLVRVKPFHEHQVAAAIKASLRFVRYAELNAIVRLIDFLPGWRVDRVA